MRPVPFILGLALFGLAAGLLWWQQSAVPAAGTNPAIVAAIPPTQNQTDSDKLSDPGQNLGSTGTPQIGGHFTLTNTSGTVVTEQSLIGKNHLLFFGFTHCPDICPGMLQTVAGIYTKMPEKTQQNLQVVFISVDPARDTLATLGSYVQAFHPSFQGWTGTKQQVDQMVKNYLVYYAIQKNPGSEPNDYMVNHSAYLYLIDKDGKYITHFRNSDSATSIATRLASLLNTQ